MARSPPLLEPFRPAMHFDDRLGTVLRQRAQGGAIARIQYRQLLDLLGTLPSEARSAQVDAGFARLHELSRQVPASARASIIDQPGLRLRSPRLIVQLTEGEPRVAAAAIRRAELRAEQWLDLVPALAPHARGMVRARDDLPPALEKRLLRLGVFERALPPPEAPSIEALIAAEEREELGAGAPSGQPKPPAATEGIGAIVRRIEDFRRARKDAEAEPGRGDSPRLPLDEENGSHRSPPRTFDFWTDSESRIVSADPAVAPMVVGMALVVGPGAGGGVGPRAERGRLSLAFRRRLPIRQIAIELTGAPVIAGTWQVDAVPLFAPMGGRFTGYAGRMRRPVAADVPTPDPVSREADRIRQLLHELRTPVNAIQGFAEVIQQQLFGPTPHEYRALAAAIAGDAARMLAGFEELERLAKLDSGAQEIETGSCDLDAIFAVTAERLEPFTSARGSRFAIKLEDRSLTVGIAQAEGERILWRLLATVAGASAPGEVLKLRARRRGDQARLSIDLPESLSARQGEELFHAGAPTGVRAPAPAQSLSAGMFGAGFSLRLARAEAAAAGGMLERRGERLRLSLPLWTEPLSTDSLSSGPLLTGHAASHSQGGGAGQLSA